MTVRIHIDRVVLDGIVLDAAQIATLQETIESSLLALASDHAAQLAQSSSTHRVQAPSIELGSQLAPQAIGAQIASSLWAGLVPGGSK